MTPAQYLANSVLAGLVVSPTATHTLRLIEAAKAAVPGLADPSVGASETIVGVTWRKGEIVVSAELGADGLAWWFIGENLGGVNPACMDATMPATNLSDEVIGWLRQVVS